MSKSLDQDNICSSRTSFKRDIFKSNSWEPKQDELKQRVGFCLFVFFFSERTVVAQVTYLQRWLILLLKFLKQEFIFFLKYMLNFLTLCFWCWNQRVKFYACDIQKSGQIWVPSTSTIEWKFEPLMALTTKTFIPIAHLPSTYKSL